MPAALDCHFLWASRVRVVIEVLLAGDANQCIFSPRNRLAESERELGLDISEEAIAQLKAHQRIEDDEFAAAALEEKRRRHDVMAHVHTYGLVAPQAAGIIHWGATSWLVTVEADLWK